MIVFLLKRLGQAVIVMFVISLVAFAVKDNLGDPLQEMLGQSVSEQEREALRQTLGLHDPFFIQYFGFVGNALQGDLGTSYFFKEPTLDVILKKLPATLDLVLGASLVIILLSVPLGVFAAIYPDSLVSRLLMGLSIIGISIPVFLTAIFAIYLFAVELNWMPAFGRGETAAIIGDWQSGFLTKDGLLHLVLPCLTLASIMLPLFIRLIRAEMLEVLQADYIKFAQAKGLRPARIWFLHALKNTMLPVITLGGVQLGTMVAYTMLTETVFQWPGMGFLFLEAVHRSDTPLIVAYLMVVGLIFIIINTAVDLVYGLINPTVNVGRELK